MPCCEGQAAGWTGLAVKKPLGPLFDLLAFPLDIWRQLFIANEPVRPEVRHFDNELVHPRLNGGREVGAERRLPQNAEVLVVQENFREILHRAQIQPQFTAGLQTPGRNINFLLVTGRAGEILYARSEEHTSE